MHVMLHISRMAFRSLTSPLLDTVRRGALHSPLPFAGVLYLHLFTARVVIHPTQLSVLCTHPPRLVRNLFRHLLHLPLHP